MIHVKSNRLTVPELRDRVRSMTGDRLRASRFVDLFDPLCREWQSGLKTAGEVDFEDMINTAAELIEAGDWTSPYQLVMVDEMQDSSNARSRLVRALVNRTGRYLFCVGDDWQSINRFAGSDLSVMTSFEQWFGIGPTVQLQRTFRSPQSICTISSQFVSKTPAQLTKDVRSEQPEYAPPMRAIAVKHPDQYSDVLERQLQAWDRDADRPLTVYVLGRYHKSKDNIDADLLTRSRWQNLTVEFSTVHAAKGKEADYIVVLDVVARGFPSAIEDDQLLTLAMPAAETFPNAEERRLFYVALTRTRRTVLLLTVMSRESPFLLELLHDHDFALEDVEGAPISITPCPRCETGRITTRTNSQTGEQFLGCDQYPVCRFTSDLPRPNGPIASRKPPAYRARSPRPRRNPRAKNPRHDQSRGPWGCPDLAWI